MFDAAFPFFVLCRAYDDFGLLEQPTGQTRVWMEDICKTHAVSPESEVVSSCIGGLLCSFSDMEDMEDWLETLRQGVGG